MPLEFKCYLSKLIILRLLMKARPGVRLLSLVPQHLETEVLGDRLVETGSVCYSVLVSEMSRGCVLCLFIAMMFFP